IEMTDAKRFQIGNDFCSFIEPELPGQLQPVGSDRDRVRHYLAPMLQKTDHGGSNRGMSPFQIARRGRKSFGRSALLFDRLATKRRWLLSRNSQFAVSTCPSRRASPNRMPASLGTISRCRMARSSRTKASCLRAGGLA